MDDRHGLGQWGNRPSYFEIIFDPAIINFATKRVQFRITWRNFFRWRLWWRWCIISAILVSSYLTQIFGNPANIREAFSFIVSTTVLFSKCTFAACFLSLENNIIFQFIVFRYRGYHIGLYNLVIGWLTLESDIWSLVDTHKSATLSPWLNHIKLQHFYVIFHVKCCRLMRFNPRTSVIL